MKNEIVEIPNDNANRLFTRKTNPTETRVRFEKGAERQK